MIASAAFNPTATVLTAMPAMPSPVVAPKMPLPTCISAAEKVRASALCVQSKAKYHEAAAGLGSTDAMSADPCAWAALPVCPTAPKASMPPVPTVSPQVQALEPPPLPEKTDHTRLIAGVAIAGILAIGGIYLLTRKAS